MLIAAFLMFAWAATCWFSAPFANPFLGLPLFHVDAAAPFAGALLFLIGAIVLRWLRSSAEDLKSFRAWARRNRKAVILLSIIIVLHIAMQAPAMVAYRGANDSDSGLYGIAGYHIADGKDRPMTCYSLHYIGTLVPHVTAVLHTAFGKHPAHQRVVNTLFYVAYILFLFLLARRILDENTALTAAALAAIPPFDVFDHLRHVEFPELLLWGTLSLLLLSHLTGRDRPRLRLWFWYGAVLGIGFYAHPQMIYFIAAGLGALFIRDKLFPFKPGMAVLLIGALCGGIVVFVDSYYFGPVTFTYFFAQAADVGSLITRLLGGAGEFLRHIPVLLGLRPDNNPRDVLTAWITWPALALAAIALALYIYRCRREIYDAVRFRNSNQGPALPLVFLFCLFLIFSVAEQSQPPSPFRYSFPVWAVIPVIIAGGFGVLSRLRKEAPIALVAVFAAVFFSSQVLKHAEQFQVDGYWREWEAFCGGHGITRFYGPYWRSYHSNFVTRERVLGSCTYPFDFERYPPYRQEVDSAASPPAFLFYADDREGAAAFERTLADLGLSFEKTGTTAGTLFHGLSQKLTPKQIAGLASGSYRAEVGEAVARSLEGRALVFDLPARNTGTVVWLPDGKHGFLELAVRADDRQLRRQPLAVTVAPGETHSWRVLLGRDEIRGASRIECAVMVNGIAVSPFKSIETSVAEAGETIRAQGLGLGPLPDSLVLAQDEDRESKSPADYMLLDGWGAVVRADKGFTLWSGGAESTLGFYLSRSRPVEVRGSAFPVSFAPDGESANWVRVYCNDSPLGDNIYLLKAGRFAIEIPGNYLRAGLNRLRFVYGRVEPEYSRPGREALFRCKPRAFAFTKIILRRASRAIASK